VFCFACVFLSGQLLAPEPDIRNFGFFPYETMYLGHNEFCCNRTGRAKQLAPIRLSLFNDNKSSKALPGEINFAFQPLGWRGKRIA
jgi:hypothetical protein